MSDISFYDIPTGEIPLYLKFSGDLAPRDARLILDPSTAEVYFEVDDGVFQDKDKNIVVHWSVDGRITREALEKIYQGIKPSIERVYDGLEFKSRGGDTVIVLDEDAEDAHEEISEFFHFTNIRHDLLDVWDVWDWCADTDYQNCVSDISSSATDDQITSMIEGMQSEVERDYCSMLGNSDEFASMLREYRDALAAITSKSTDCDIELIVNKSQFYLKKTDHEDFMAILMEYRDNI